MDHFVDLYTDYLISSSSYTTATGMGNLLGISHDKITQELHKGNFDSKFLWNTVKVYVHEMYSSTSLVTLSFDDTIQEKSYTDDSELNTWHYDHSKGRSVKGVNMLSALIETQGMRLPVWVGFVKKDLWVTNAKTGKPQRKSSISKNEQFRSMLIECFPKLNIDFVLADIWYSSKENMLCCEALDCHFIMAVKSNRLVATSKENKLKREYVRIDSLQLGQQAVEVWFKDLDFPLLLTKQVFKNEDDTVGELYLACNELNLSYDQITTIYKKRWGVEEYHKSIKCNTSFAKSPTKIIKTQTNHYVLSIIAYIKLERLKQRHDMSHFAMKQQIYLCAQKAAYDELKKLSTKRSA